MREFSIFAPVYPDVHYHVDHAVATEIIEPLLSLFRGMYLEKGERTKALIHSMV